MPGVVHLLASVILAVALWAWVPRELSAQVTRADSAAVLLRAAREFQAEGRWEVAEALLQHIRERYSDTPAARVALDVLSAAPPESAGRSGQVELMVWATTYGAWLGVAIPGALGADDPGPYGAGLLLATPAGFLAGRAMGRSRPRSAGQVRAITFGSLWGTWQGYGILDVLDLGESEHCDLDVCDVSGPDGADVFKAMVVGGAAGTVIGSVLSRKPISSGAATAANFGALWGTWFGVAGGVLAGLEGDPLLTSTLLGGDAGLFTAAFLAPRWKVTRNRARLVSIAGVLGGLVGAGLDLLIQPHDDKVAIGIPLAGSLAGLGIGVRLTAGTDAAGAAGGPMENEGAGAAGPGLSLLQVGDGRVGLGVPMPYPVVVEVETARGIARRPALGLTWLGWRF